MTVSKIIEKAVGAFVAIIVIATLGVAFFPTVQNLSGNLYYSGIAFASLFNPTLGIIVILYSLGVFGAMIGSVMLIFKVHSSKRY